METIVERVWSKSKVLVKGLIIALLVLLLLIPTFFVKNLIEERQNRQQEAVVEVSSKWAGKQNFTGPVFVLPYYETVLDTAKKVVNIKHAAFFLPDQLQIRATLIPQERSRGIYKVMLYTAQLDVTGSFDAIPFQKLKIPADRIQWNEAYVKMTITDTKGLNEELKLKWNDSLLTLTPQAFTDGLADGLVATVPLTEDNHGASIHFSTRISINGSEQLLFTPLGKTTTVQLTSAWPHPSFTGTTLPQMPGVSKSGFNAVWNSLSYKRSFPQYWTDAASIINANGKTDPYAATYNLFDSAFGVNLFIPVNDYQKTMRSIKYAVLCILLTFAAFFLIETVNKKSVHPFQYGLIGLALILFYVLLLSVSEYTGFNTAYLIASVAIIALIGWFVRGILDSGRLSSLLSVILLIVYVYIFSVLQLQDYALLLGSIGLFVSLAVIMQFSRKFKW